MVPTDKSYIVKETLISVFINAAISAAFAFLVFGGRTDIALWGLNGMALDFVPQTFMIAMMSVLVPSALTRRRMKSDPREPTGSQSSARLNNLLLRAALAALFATMALGGAAVGLSAVFWQRPFTFVALLPLKIIYGAVVAMVITPLALRVELAGQK